MAKITIKDVAREAGVSISTVSNALNDVNVLTPQTKQHVLEVAERLNYIPDLRGKNLKSSKTQMIGFFTATVGGAYFHVLVESMARECERQGYGLNIFVSNNKKVMTNNLFSGTIDGALIFSFEHIKEREVEIIKSHKLNSVFLDREIQTDHIGSVLFDSYNSGYEATSYLIHLGHRSIVYIEGSAETYDNSQRKAGYMEALKDNGIKPNPDYIIRGFYVKEGGYNAVKEFIREYPGDIPDAFLAGNDLSAIGCIEALESEGLRVPEDISVMGFDDIQIAQYHEPSLSTVRNSIARQGVLSVQHVINMIEGKETGKIQKLPGKIIGRDSSVIRTRSRD